MTFIYKSLSSPTMFLRYRFCRGSSINSWMGKNVCANSVAVVLH